MATISDLFDYGGGMPQKEYYEIYDPGRTRVEDRRRDEWRWTSGSGGRLAGSNPLDDLLAGYDEESEALTNKLRSIYDGYTGSYEELEGNIRPIMDLIEGDIEKFEEYIGDYEGLVSGMQGDFLDSIIIDPSATRTRSEYMGNVAAQYDQAEATRRRQAIQQGQNPYADRGAQRSFALDRAGAMAGAANQAYGDWRAAYNRDIQAQQQANEAYANLQGRQGEMYGDLLRSRGALINVEKGILDTRLDAEKARAAGYEGLTGLVENRRQQAIQLGQQQQVAEQQNRMRAASLPGNRWEARSMSPEFAPNYPTFS